MTNNKERRERLVEFLRTHKTPIVPHREVLAWFGREYGIGHSHAYWLLKRMRKDQRIRFAPYPSELVFWAANRWQQIPRYLHSIGRASK